MTIGQLVRKMDLLMEDIEGFEKAIKLINENNVHGVLSTLEKEKEILVKEYDRLSKIDIGEIKGL
jgi:hypothetical protein